MSQAEKGIAGKKLGWGLAVWMGRDDCLFSQADIVERSRYGQVESKGLVRSFTSKNVRRFDGSVGIVWSVQFVRISWTSWNQFTSAELGESKLSLRKKRLLQRPCSFLRPLTLFLGFRFCLGNYFQQRLQFPEYAFRIPRTCKVFVRLQALTASNAKRFSGVIW